MLGYPKSNSSSLGQQKIPITQLDSQLKTNQLLTVNASGNYQLIPKSDLIINVDQLDPSTTPNDALVTNSNLELQWQKIGTANTSFANQGLLTSSTPSFSQVSVNSDPVSNLQVATKQYVDSRVLQDNSVSTQKIQDNAVTVTKIADASLANQVLLTSGDTNPTWGFIQTANISDSQITTAKIADSNVTTAKIADSNVTTAKIADSAITTAKIANNAVTLQKIQHPQNPNEILLSKGNTNPVWGLIENQNITDNTIQQEKIVSLPFSKITSTINLNQISDTLITKQKLNMPKNAKQLFVDFVLGDDNFEGSNLKPYKTLQKAVDVSEQATVIHVMSNITENVIIDGKNQIAICYNSSKIHNSPNLTHTGQIWVKNSQSIKFQGIQLTCTQNNTHALILENTSTFFCKESTIISSSANYGVLVNNCVYSQFQNCEFSLYLTANPITLNTVLIYQNSNLVNSISNSSSNYLIAFDQSIIQGALNFSNSSLFIYNSQIYQNLIYSANSPNTLILFNNRFYDTSLNLKTLSKSGTSPMIYQNNILNQSSSIFGNTRIYQQLVLNSDIQNLNKSKIIFDQLVQANEINNIDKNQVIFTTNKITNNDISNDIDKSKILLSSGQENQLLACDNTGRIKFVNQQQQLVYNNNPDNFLAGDGFWKKIDTLDKFDSANTISSQYISGNTAIFWGQLNIDQSTAQIRYFNLQTLCENSPNSIIPISSINFNSTKKYGFLGQINSDVSNRDLFQISHIPAYALDFNLMTLVNNGNTVTNPINKYYQTDSNGKQFFGDAPSSISLNRAQFIIGNNSNQNQAIKLNQDAKFLDEAYSSTNVNVPLNMVLTTNNLENNMKWSKIYQQNLSTTNNPTNSQILSYNSAQDNFTWINNTASISDDSITQQKFAFQSNSRIQKRLMTINTSNNLTFAGKNYQNGIIFDMENTIVNSNINYALPATSFQFYGDSSNVYTTDYSLMPMCSTTLALSGTTRTVLHPNASTYNYCYNGWQNVQKDGFNGGGYFHANLAGSSTSNFPIIASQQSTYQIMLSFCRNNSITTPSQYQYMLTGQTTFVAASDRQIKYNIEYFDKSQNIIDAYRFLDQIKIAKFFYNNQLKQNLTKDEFRYSVQKHVGFVYQDLEDANLNYGCLSGNAQNNYSQSAKQYLVENGYIDQQTADQYYNEICEEKNTTEKSVAFTEVTSVMYIALQDQIKKVQELENKLTKIEEILARNNIQ